MQPTRPKPEFYFTTEAIDDYKSSLTSFGTVTKAENTYSVERGGVEGLHSTVTGSLGKKLSAFIYVTKDGKLGQLVLDKPDFLTIPLLNL